MQKVIYAIGGLLALMIAGGLLLPRHGNVVVTSDIDAHPATVFALVNDFRRVQLWDPVTDPDPNARIVYSGPPRGVGATMTWDGGIIGTGTQTITVSEPFGQVATSINDGEAITWFELRGNEGQTSVSWGYETDYGYNIAGRYLAWFLQDSLRQKYQAGLAHLRQLAESLPGTDFGDLEIEHLVVDAARIAYLPVTAAPTPAAISEAMGAAYFRILSFIDRHGLFEDGAPISVLRSFSGSALLFEAAIPIRGVGEDIAPDRSGVRIGETYAGPVIRVRHVGSYRSLSATHRKIAAYLAALDIERAGDAWEAYVSDPTRVPEQELLTFVYYPIAP